MSVLSCLTISLLFGLGISQSSPRVLTSSSSVDAAITTQYADTWNYGNGVFYPTGSSDEFGISDKSETYSSRYLLRFNLAKLKAGTFTVLNATLSLTLVNWDVPVDLQACFLADSAAWQGTSVGPKYEGTGWINRMYDIKSKRSIPWTQPGGWSDCNTSLGIMTIQNIQEKGRATRKIKLHPAAVASWLTRGGYNNGLLFKGQNGSVTVITSSSKGTSTIRPSLRITLATMEESKPPTKASPPPLARPPTASKPPPVTSPRLSPPSPIVSPIPRISPPPRPPPLLSSPSPRPPAPPPPPTSLQSPPPPLPFSSSGVRPFAIAASNRAGYQGRLPDGSCPVFPTDTSPWHFDISQYPVHPNSDAIKALISSTASLHPDFAGGDTVDDSGRFVNYGIPFIYVNTSTGQPPFYPVDVVAYADESDPGLYPIPYDAPIEGTYPGCPVSSCGGDRHVIVVDNATCVLYETYYSIPPSTPSGSWIVNEAVMFNLTNNRMRPLGWTSADAAGLPIFPGLVKYDEVVNRGVIDHAIRFTGPNSRAAYEPGNGATHFAPYRNTGPNSPWMGMRVRLKATYNCSQLRPAARVVCVALKKYGAIFADNGSPWFLSGEATDKWARGPVVEALQDIKRIPSSMMEVVQSGCLCTNSACTTGTC